MFSFFMMWSLVVADSVIDGSNVSFVHVGWYPETPGYDRSVHSVHIERSRFVNGHDIFSGAITDFSVNVFELRVIDSVIDRNSVTGASVVITGYYYGSIVFRNTSISDNMINRTDASWGAVLSGIAAAGVSLGYFVCFCQCILLGRCILPAAATRAIPPSMCACIPAFKWLAVRLCA